MQRNYLSAFDELVLLAIAFDEGEPYGVTIHGEVERATKGSVPIGTVYAALERLEEQGLLSSYRGDPTPERGGRAKRFYRIETAGREALRAAENARNDLRANQQLCPAGAG